YFHEFAARQGLTKCRFILFLRYDFFLQELGQHDISPFRRRVDATIGRKPIRCADQPRQESRFSYGELGELFRKIKLRSLRNAEDALGPFLAQVNFIQVVFQDLIFGIFSLRDQRHNCFLNLAAELTLIAKEEIFHQLLGQRTSALHNSRAANIDPKGAQDGDGIDAVMAIETLVFSRQNRFDHQGWHVRQFYDFTLLPSALVETGHEFRLKFEGEHLLAAGEVFDFCNDIILQRNPDWNPLK